MDTPRHTDPVTGKLMPPGVILCSSCGGWLRQASAYETESKYGVTSYHHFRCISALIGRSRPQRERRAYW